MDTSHAQPLGPSRGAGADHTMVWGGVDGTREHLLLTKHVPYLDVHSKGPLAIYGSRWQSWGAGSTQLIPRWSDLMWSERAPKILKRLSKRVKDIIFK